MLEEVRFEPGRGERQRSAHLDVVVGGIEIDGVVDRAGVPREVLGRDRRLAGDSGRPADIQVEAVRVVADILLQEREVKRVERVLRNDPVFVDDSAVAAAVFVDLVRV